MTSHKSSNQVIDTYFEKVKAEESKHSQNSNREEFLEPGEKIRYNYEAKETLRNTEGRLIGTNYRVRLIINVILI